MNRRVTAGEKKDALERRAKLPKGWLSQISGGAGVGTKTAEALAPLMGFQNYPSLIVAAHEWWKVEGEALYKKRFPTEADDPGRAQALRAYRATGTASEEVIALVVEEFGQVKGKPWDWWIAQLALVERTKRAERDERVLSRKARRRRRPQPTDDR